MSLTETESINSIRKISTKTEKEISISIRKKYYRSIFLFLSSCIGFFGYSAIFKGLGWLRLVFFLIPIIFLCSALTGTRKKFNYVLFMLILFLMFLFSSILMSTGFILLSVSATPPDLDYPEFAMDLFNYNMTLNAIDSFLTPIFFFIFVGVPAILIAGGIWAIMAGKINEGVKAIIKVFVIFVMLTLVVLVFDGMGMEIPGVTQAIRDSMDTYMNMIDSIYEWATSMGVDIDPNATDTSFGGRLSIPPGSTGDPNTKATDVLPDGNLAADSNGDGVVDWWEQFCWDYAQALSVGTMDALKDATLSSPIGLQICIASSLPMTISGINVLFSLIFLSKKARMWNDEFFDDFLPKEEKVELHLLHFNYKMGAFVTIIIFCAWLMFLNFARIYEETGVFQFTQIGYISIYMIMIAVPVIFLSMPRVAIYTKSNWKNTLKGTVFGLGILFLSFSFLTGTSRTLDAYSLEHTEFVWEQVLNNLIFVAPAESMFFHVFLLSFVLGWMYRRGMKNSRNLSEAMVQDQTNKIDTQIETIELIKNAFPKGKKETLSLSKQINELKEEKATLGVDSVLRKNFMFQDFNSYILVYIVIILANFLFSISHWIILAGTIDFFVFWLSGLGIIYLVAGVIITVIGWRYGWLSAILVHSIYNITQIIMALMYSGAI